MKLTQCLRNACIGLAAIGLVLPHNGLVRGTEIQRPHTSVAITDVSLSEGGVLQGQVVSSQGQGLANSPVTVHQGKTELAATVTDGNGKFAVKGLKGGVYVVSTAGASHVVRAWMPRTAPPSSVAAVLLVPDQATVRAQLTGMNLGLGALVVGGIIATVIAVSIDHNSAS